MRERPPSERQREILTAIERFAAEHGYPPSVREIGEIVGLSSSSTIHAHLKTLEKRGLLTRDATKPRAMRSERSGMPEGMLLPILGRVAAGVPIAAQEEREGEFLVAADFLPKGSDAFVLRVKGDSMIDAAILDGDLVVVRPQNDARNGEIVVAMLEGDATVQRFYREAGRVRLQPENARMQPIYADDVVIVGRVEAVIRRL